MPSINFTSSTFEKKPANTVVVLSPNIIKQGDQKHDLRIQLLRGETPVDLTGKTVLWSAASTKGKFITDRKAEVSSNGEVSLSLINEDAGAFGELRVEIKVIHEDGKVEKFPANDFARFTITYSLDDITNTPVYFASVAFFEQKVNQAENAAETAKQAAMSAEHRAVYVEQQGDIAESQGLFAQAKATEARDQAALAKQVAEENKTNWKQEVATVALRNSTYPNPQIGDTVRITGEARIDRFNGTKWITTDRYNPTAIDEVTVKLAEKAAKTEVQSLVTNKAEKSSVEVTNQRIDALTIPISPENANIEVTDAHVSVVKNKTFSSLRHRFEDTEKNSYFPVRNIAINGDLSNGLTGWSSTTASSGITVSDNKLLATGKGATISVNAINISDVPVKIGNKYYLRVKVKVTNAESTKIILQFDGSANGTNKTVYTLNNPVQDQEYIISLIDTLPNDATGTFKIILSHEYATASASTGKVMEVSYLNIIDLTSTFGAGNEPKLSDVEGLLAKFTNSYFNGTENLFNAESVMKKVLNTTSNNTPNNTLFDSGIKGTIQSITFNTDGAVQKVQHKDKSNVVIREDVFTYSANLITEVRTLISSGEVLTFKNNLDTLQTEVI